MASRQMGNVIDLGRARDIRRQRNARIEINWGALVPMVTFVMWAALIIGTVWVWRHVL